MRPLAVSTGDPGGVGPEVALRAALAHSEELPPVVLFGDAAWLAARARELGAGDRLRELALDAELDLPRGALAVAHVGEAWDESALRHEATREGGAAQLAALDAALDSVRSGRARALCTAPMSKAAVSLTGASFVGHTEHLARAAGLADDDVTMMFLGPRLRVALVTTHLSIARLPAAITRPRVTRTVRHLAEALLRAPAPQVEPFARQRFRRVPRLVVTGLNPHAGEDRLFGDEEHETIAPALAALREEPPFSDGRVQLIGPIAAETAFRQAQAGEVDAVAAMAHDQATIASKLLDWGEAVNVTWGLPFVRTSVDHGVAYDAARGGQVDARGMQAALELCARLAPVDVQEH
jgi:4-hydroxythreonine-4-phosphate dehydrogenase